MINEAQETLEEKIEDLTVDQINEILKKFPDIPTTGNHCPVCGAGVISISHEREFDCRCRSTLHKARQEKERRNNIEDFFDDFEAI